MIELVDREPGCDSGNGNMNGGAENLLEAEEEKDMPAGWPYSDWHGVALFALEYVLGMQGLVMGWMEGRWRWGGARVTT